MKLKMVENLKTRLEELLKNLNRWDFQEESENPSQNNIDGEYVLYDEVIDLLKEVGVI